MKLIRVIVGSILKFLDFITSPKSGHRTEENKAAVQNELKQISLYQFASCPFCIKVRRTMKRLNLDVELRDSKTDPYKTELLEKGGRLMAPCLRIDSGDESQWMYESNDIINYLETRFPLQA